MVSTLPRPLTGPGQIATKGPKREHVRLFSYFSSRRVSPHLKSYRATIMRRKTIGRRNTSVEKKLTRKTIIRRKKGERYGVCSCFEERSERWESQAIESGQFLGAEWFHISSKYSEQLCSRRLSIKHSQCQNGAVPAIMAPKPKHILPIAVADQRCNADPTAHIAPSGPRH
jgi:hypothetical protein